jgi:HlyD family secretion protein
MRLRGSRKALLAWKLLVGLFVLGLGAAGVGIWGPWGKAKAPAIATVEVKLGEFVDYVELRGEIRVRSSTVITSPYNAGDLQILKLYRDGGAIKKGDVLVEFDPTSLKRNADQFRSTLKQVEAEIQRANAQQRLREEQILTDVMSAQFGLDRARLDASTRDVIPALEHEKNLLALAKAEQKVREVETRIASSRIAAEADLAGTIRRRDKAKADLDQAERNLAALTLLSPVDGIITLLPNYRARTSVLGGGTTPVFKEGDRAWAGAALAEVPELATIQANAPVYEADRGKVAPGQPVTLRVDGVPDKEHKGSVGDISTLAKLDYSSYPIRKSFDLTVRLDQPDRRLRPGMSANFRVEVERIPNVIVIPAEAVFDKGGRIAVYVLANGVFVERSLEVARRGDGKIMVARGIKPGERIALKDPSLAAEQK